MKVSGQFSREDIAMNKKHIRVADIDYNKESSKTLRESLIKLRNEKLTISGYDPVGMVILSHAIAWMNEAINIIYPTENKE